MRIVLLGPPGSGKAELSQKISDHYGMPIVTVSSVMQRAAAEQTELGRLAKEAMDMSRVSDELLLALLRIQLPQMDLRKGFILVDLPKNAGQADVLDSVLNDLDAGVELVLNLEVDPDELMERLVGRITCDNCGAQYNLYVNPPLVDGVCDACGARVVRRPDDYEETISNRLRVYEAQMGPLLQYYRLDDKLRAVEADEGPQRAWKASRKLIDAMPPSIAPGSVLTESAPGAPGGKAQAPMEAPPTKTQAAASKKSVAKPAAKAASKKSPAGRQPAAAVQKTAAGRKAAPERAAAKPTTVAKAPSKAKKAGTTQLPAGKVAEKKGAAKKSVAKAASTGGAAAKKSPPRKKKAGATKVAEGTSPKGGASKRGAVKKPAVRAPTDRSSPKKAAAKKSAAKKPATRKVAAKKVAAKKVAARRAVAKKAIAKQLSNKKRAAARPTAGKAATKKKSGSGKVAAKKASVGGASAKKASPKSKKKAAAKKTSGPRPKPKKR